MRFDDVRHDHGPRRILNCHSDNLPVALYHANTAVLCESRPGRPDRSASSPADVSFIDLNRLSLSTASSPAPSDFWRIMYAIRYAVLYVTPSSRSSCFADMPQRVLVIRYIA